MARLERRIPFTPQDVQVGEHIGAKQPATRLRACNHRTRFSRPHCARVKLTATL
jgi:hypothetical protein